MSKHASLNERQTALPWIARGCDDIDTMELFGQAGFDGGLLSVGLVHKPDAPIILQAVNSYQAMRGALEQVKGVLEEHGDFANISIVGAVDLINSVLTLANGKESQ